MKPTTLTSMAFVAATQVLGALAATPTKGATPTQIPSVVPIPNQLTSHGCYSSGANFTEQSGVSSVSSGKCYDTCRDANYYVSALKGSKCYCGMVYPPTKDLSDDSACNYPCPGYSIEACGSIEDGGHWSVFNTGIEVDVSEYEPEVSSTAAPSSTQPSAQTSAAATTTATETSIPGESSDGEKKKSGPNVAGIAAGVVVGVVVMGAGIGSLFFVVRRKRNAEIEEEHRRNAAVNAFINGSKPPGSAGSISMTDSRLDPVMAHRRLSDGSIADNQDYSRRILRVTNA